MQKIGGIIGHTTIQILRQITQMHRLKMCIAIGQSTTGGIENFKADISNILTNLERGIQRPLLTIKGQFMSRMFCDLFVILHHGNPHITNQQFIACLPSRLAERIGTRHRKIGYLNLNYFFLRFYNTVIFFGACCNEQHKRHQ